MEDEAVIKRFEKINAARFVRICENMEDCSKILSESKTKEEFIERLDWYISELQCLESLEALSVRTRP